MKKHSSGFILIEAVVAMMVFALGVLGVIKLQVAVVAESSAAKARAEAMTIAQAQMDTLRLIARQTEHYSTAGGCAAGTLLASSASPVSITGINATFSETWTVTVGCTPSPRHQVQVTVTWTDPKYGSQSVRLDGAIAWNDPIKNYPTLAGSGSGSGGGLGTPTNVHLGDENQDYTTQPGTKNGKDGTSINYNSDTKEYELVVPMSSGGGYRVGLYSNVPIVRITGLVVLDPTSSPDYAVALGNGSGQLRLTDVAVYRTDITYCLYPLSFFDQNDPSTYGSSNGTNEGQTSGTSDRAGAYVCYVPEGWAGNVGLLNYELGTAGNPKYYACPDDRVDSSVFSGARSHKVEIVNGSNVIVGQSGVLQGHQTMVMPNYENLTRLSRLDFLVFKIPNGTFTGCAQRIGSSTGVIASGTNSNGAAYSVTMRTGAPVDRTTATTAYTPGVPSLRYSAYAVDRYVSTVDGGFVKLSGSYTGGCTNSNVRAVGSSNSFICSASSNTYTCTVRYGWSGDVGYWNGSALSGGGSVTNIVANSTSGPAVTCP